jgi:hypothetical protein
MPMEPALCSRAHTIRVGRLVARLVAAACCISGCVQTELTRTGPKQTPRDENCAFRIFTSVPSSGFVEIGTIDVSPIDATRSLSELKEQIQAYVCQAGGDAAVAITNGAGSYIKATVLKRSKAEVTLAGCQYDAQCKGERVCVKGECVDPAPKPN